MYMAKKVTESSRSETMAALLAVVILFVQFTHSDGCEGKKFGPEDLTRYSANIDSASDYGIVSTSAATRINCCGVIKRWKALGKEAGDVFVTVWRSTGNGQSYKLVGKSKLTIRSPGDVVNVVQPKNARISVEDGDFIGFYDPGSATVSYGTGSGSNIRMPMANVEVGATADWSAGSPASGRIYAFGAIGGNNSPPSFSNLPKTVELDEPEIGSSVFTIKGSDPDTYDIPNLQYVTENTSPYFTLNPTTGEVILTQAPPVGVHTLKIRVTDHCGATSVANLKLNVISAAVEPEPVSEPGPEHLWVVGVVLGILALAAILAAAYLLDYYGKMPGRRASTRPTDTEGQRNGQGKPEEQKNAQGKQDGQKNAQGKPEGQKNAQAKPEGQKSAQAKPDQNSVNKK